MTTGNVLLLNGAYQPISVISWQRAITLLYTQMSSGQMKAEVVSSYEDKFLRSFKVTMKMPAVIRLVKYIRPKKNVTIFKALKRKNIYERDDGVCQYCLSKISYNNSTLDHVHPRSKGGKDSWDNLVLSCQSCNNKKGDRSVKEANMTLARNPYAPKLFDSLDVAVIEKIREIKRFANAEWAEYLSHY